MTDPADDDVAASKFLSLVLRHDPESIGLQLDARGWADVSELIAAASGAGWSLDVPRIRRLVAQSDKQRFALSDDGRRIRANQGHSIDVSLGLSPREPPELLFHGTATRFLPGIRRSGLESGQRQHVHLAADEATAIAVGSRYGDPVVLRVRAGALHREGHALYLAQNGVWLTAHVPLAFLEFPDSKAGSESS